MQPKFNAKCDFLGLPWTLGKTFPPPSLAMWLGQNCTQSWLELLPAPKNGRGHNGLHQSRSRNECSMQKATFCVFHGHWGKIFSPLPCHVVWPELHTKLVETPSSTKEGKGHNELHQSSLCSEPSTQKVHFCVFHDHWGKSFHPLPCHVVRPELRTKLVETPSSTKEGKGHNGLHQSRSRNECSMQKDTFCVFHDHWGKIFSQLPCHVVWPELHTKLVELLHSPKKGRGKMNFTNQAQETRVPLEV